MLYWNLYLNMMTNSKQLFVALKRGKYTSEHGQSIDIGARRDAYKTFKITTTGLVSGNVKPADAYSKAGGSSALRRAMRGRDRAQVVKWIIRKTTDYKVWSQCEKG